MDIQISHQHLERERNKDNDVIDWGWYMNIEIEKKNKMLNCYSNHFVSLKWVKLVLYIMFVNASQYLMWKQTHNVN